MSHYTKLATKLTDPDALCQALADVGYAQVERHAEPVPLYGFQGDQRADQAHIIVRRQYISRMANDIGFLREADGTYTAIISEFDKRRHDEAWANKLAQRYALNVVVTNLTAQGYELAQTIEESNGSLRLVLHDYSLQ
jgi:hypothetical protein